MYADKYCPGDISGLMNPETTKVTLLVETDELDFLIVMILDVAL
jgi:hypothetical protein